jgi:hypothetical protein
LNAEEAVVGRLRGLVVVVVVVVGVVVVAGGGGVVAGETVEPGELGWGDRGERNEGEGEPARDTRGGETERDGGSLLQLRLHSH